MNQRMLEGVSGRVRLPETRAALLFDVAFFPEPASLARTGPPKPHLRLAAPVQLQIPILSKPATAATALLISGCKISQRKMR